MRLFLLALLLDASVLVFVTTAVWFAHGWFGVFMYAVASIGANLLYMQAKPKLLIIRRKSRDDPQVDP